MDIQILEQNQNNLELFKNAIAGFASPKILDAQMENLKVLDKNLYESKQQKKETKAWIKENKQDEMYSQYNSFFRRYEKCFNKIQNFQKKFSHNTISLQLDSCKDLLTETFEAKANLNAQTYSLAQSNFCADIHGKSILIESNYQKGSINADSAFEHISRLQNSMHNPLANNDENLKSLINSYSEDYSSKAIFKNRNGSYEPENIISETTTTLCQAENSLSNELQDLMDEATQTILDLNKRLNITKINNMLVDAQQFIATFGTAGWDEAKAKKFMDKFENNAADLERLELEFEAYQSKLSELIDEIEEKKEQTKQANKQIAKTEAENRLNKLIENVKHVQKLVKNNTPYEILKQHYSILKDDYKEIEKTLGTDAVDSIMQKLGKTKEELEDLKLSIKQLEMLSISEQKTDEHVLEYKPNTDEDGKPKN